MQEMFNHPIILVGLFMSVAATLLGVLLSYGVFKMILRGLGGMGIRFPAWVKWVFWIVSIVSLALGVYQMRGMF